MDRHFWKTKIQEFIQRLTVNNYSRLMNELFKISALFTVQTESADISELRHLNGIYLLDISTVLMTRLLHTCRFTKMTSVFSINISYSKLDFPHSKENNVCACIVVFQCSQKSLFVLLNAIVIFLFSIAMLNKEVCLLQNV